MELLLSHLAAFLSFLPDPPTGTPNELAKDGIDFFQLWISRIGGIVAFIGAVKFALGVKDDEAKEQLQGVLIMVSGFMIQAAVGNLDIFNIPATYSDAAAETEFESILQFIGRWVRRVGALAMLIGATMFGFSIKDNDAVKKVSGLKTMAAGGIAVSVSAFLHTFV
ncbi:MAG: hypothetical protein IKW90_15815 [Lachnospiraceae bacterium]|nr:hypothetical protein [Lachnospiraceae bacterium]